MIQKDGFKIIIKTTAAAIPYGLNEKIQGKRNICIFDLGGGTFDVTILEINNNKFTVKATGSYPIIKKLKKD